MRGRAAFSGKTACSRAFLAAGLLAVAGTARADEPMFGYVNTTDLLPAAKLQAEQSLAMRRGGVGDYRLLESRTEIDYGLTSDVQLTGYLNASRLRAELSAPPALAGRFAPTGPVSRDRVDSVTGEAIWRIQSPYLRPVGLAILADVTGGHGKPVFGLKTIVQKNLRDDTVILAANLRADFGQRETTPPVGGLPAAARAVTPVEFALGASYRFRPNWSAAMELRGRSKYLGAWTDGDRQFAALFLGPTLHYGGQRWFLTLTALARLQGSHRSPAPGEAVNGLAYAAERSRWDGLRLRVGRTFG